MRHLTLIYLVCEMAGLGWALRPVALRKGSYGKIPLLSSTEPIDEDSSLRKLQIVLRPHSENGALLSLDDTDRHIYFGVRNGFLSIQLKEKGQLANDVIVSDEQITIHQLHLINVEFLYSQQKISVTIDEQLPKTHYSAAYERFQLNQASILHIGSPNSDDEDTTLSCCLHRVVMNDRYMLLPDGAIELRDLGRCDARTATTCGENYCGVGGICYTTIGCDKQLHAEEVARRRVPSENSDRKHSSGITADKEEQWIEYEFGNMAYVRGFVPTTRCDAALKRAAWSGNATISLQFGDHRTLHNYTYDGQTKMFRFGPIAYLSWPVAASRVKVQLRTQGTGSPCHVTMTFRGCPAQDADIWSYLEPEKWTLLIHTDLASLNDTVTSYGIAGNAHATPTSEGFKFKSKWVDLLPSDHELTWKVEFLRGGNAVTWMATACSVAMGKRHLASEVWSLERTASGDLCFWTREDKENGAFIDVADRTVRVSIQRPQRSYDNFIRLPGLAVDGVGPSAHPLAGNTSENCATSCAKREGSRCLGFQRTKMNGSSVCGAVLGGMRPDALKLNEDGELFVLKAAHDSGFQCQCVNGMIGARCDNNSHHDYTYHVTISDRQSVTELECPSTEGMKFVIDVEFAIGEVSNFEKNVHVARLVKVLCNGEQACSLSVDTINSLLPSGGRPIKLLEVRYACSLLRQAEALKMPTPAPTTAATAIENDSEGSSACRHCDVTDDVEVFEKKHQAPPESEVFLLNLFEPPTEVTSPSERLIVTSSFSSVDVISTTGSYTEEITTHLEASTGAEATSSGSNEPTAQSIATDNNTTIVNKLSCSELKTEFRNQHTNNSETACPEGSEIFRRSFCVEGEDDEDAELVERTECVSSGTLEISEVLKLVTQGTIADPSILQHVAQEQNKLLTSRGGDVLPGDIIENTRMLEKIVYLQSATIADQESLSESSNQVSESVLKSVDTLLDESLQETWDEIEENERSSVADQLTQAVDSVGFLLANNMNNSETATKFTKNTALQVMALRPNLTQQTYPDGRISFPQSQSTGAESWMEEAGKIVLPFDEDFKQPTRFVFAVYSNLDSLLGNSYNEPKAAETELGIISNVNTSVRNTIAHNENHVVNSFVMSASMRPLPKDLIAQKKINFVLQHRTPSSALTKCVFWKAGVSGRGGSWSSDGCRVVASNRTHTRCQCNHLTNFAILMNVAGTKLDATTDFVLTLMTWIGCSMSITCLVTCLFCFNALRGLRSIRNSIHKNLCVTLALAQTLFLVGVDKTDLPILCTSIAVMLHYLFLSVFCWMSVEGLHLYVSLVQVFEIDKRSRLAAYYAYSYGAPAVVVAISMALRYDGYGNAESCWLAAKDDHLIWSFAGPALAVICVNTCYFIVALRVMRAHRITTPAHQTKLAKAKIWIKGSSVLLCLLGITWIFGLFYVDERTVVMAYIFTVCNALQGVFIFVFHCLMNERVKAELGKYFRRSSCCPSCVRRRYHVTSSVNARSAYVTTTSFGIRGRHTSSGMAESSSRSIKSSSWIKVKTPNPKLRKIVERKDTPHWKNDATSLPVADQPNHSKTNGDVDEAPYFGLTVTNPHAEQDQPQQSVENDSPVEENQEPVKSGSNNDKTSNVDFSDKSTPGTIPSNSPNPIHRQLQLPVDKHDALTRHRSLPVPSNPLSVENSPQHGHPVDDSLLFFNLDLSLHFKNENL